MFVRSNVSFPWAAHLGLQQMSVSCVFSAPVPVDFRADLLSAPIGDIGLDDLAATAHGCQRTVERIAAVPLDVIQMSVHHDGSYRASFEGRETVFGDGDVSLLGMHRKFDYVTRESSRTTTVSIPTRLLGQQAAQIDSLNRPGVSGGRVLPVPAGSGGCSHGSTSAPSRWV